MDYDIVTHMGTLGTLNSVTGMAGKCIHHLLTFKAFFKSYFQDL
jgi:hypothetical protein